VSANAGRAVVRCRPCPDCSTGIDGLHPHTVAALPLLPLSCTADGMGQGEIGRTIGVGTFPAVLPSGAATAFCCQRSISVGIGGWAT